MTTNPMTDRELEALIEDVEAASEEAYGAPLAEHSDPYFYDFCQLIVRKQLARIRSKLPWPKVFGTGRVADNPKELSVNFHAVPTDDELRAFDEAVKGHGATLPTEAQPEVTGAVAWVRTINGEIDWAEDCLGSMPGGALDCYDGEEYDEIPLYPPSAIEAAVRERLEEALNLAQTIKVPERNGFNQAGLHAWDMAVAEYWKAIRALMESPHPSVEEPAN